MRNDEMRVEHGIDAPLHGVVRLDAAAARRAARGDRRAPARATASTSSSPTQITPRRVRSPRRSRGLADNYDKAVAIERWLETNLTYTLELEDPGKQEPIHFFLFDRKKGHCEYFASAFVDARARRRHPHAPGQRLPRRRVERDQGYVAVRAGDAHSWDEVFFPGKGWVTFDPTPSPMVGELGRGGSGWRAKIGASSTRCASSGRSG